MNFCLTISGYRFKTYDDCLKLLVYSAGKADYITEVKGFGRLTPFSPCYNEVFLTGSSKKTYRNVVMDFDGIIEVPDKKSVTINPETVGLEALPDAVHYWGMMGALFKVISDVSPAYVTGYLLEKNMRKELETFTGFANRLPFALQVAINELMTDAD